MVKLYVKHISTKPSSKGLRLTFETANKIHELDALQMEKAPGFLLFSPDEFRQAVEDAMKDKTIGVDLNGKSPSTRLRGQLFQVWNNKHKNTGVTWEDWYKYTMEDVILYFTNELQK